jgi:hypothetical protein
MSKNNLFQFHSNANNPTFKWITEKFDVKLDSIDKEYGIICTDSVDKLYTIMVDDDAKLMIEEYLKKNKNHHSGEGLFSNPSIEPF